MRACLGGGGMGRRERGGERVGGGGGEREVSFFWRVCAKGVCESFEEEGEVEDR